MTLSIRITTAEDPKCCVIQDQKRCNQLGSCKITLKGNLSITGKPVLVCEDHADLIIKSWKEHHKISTCH